MGVDDSASPDGQAIMGKFVVFPHLHAVVAGRGIAGFMSLVQFWLNTSGYSLDRLMVEIPKKLPELLLQMVRGDLGFRPLVSDGYGQEIIVVGWSASTGVMRARAYSNRDRADNFVEDDLSIAWTAPWEDSMPEWSENPTPEEMYRMAQLQVDLHHRRIPGGVAGGRFHVAEITPSGIHVTTAGPLVPPAQHPAEV